MRRIGIRSSRRLPYDYLIWGEPGYDVRALADSFEFQSCDRHNLVRYRLTSRDAYTYFPLLLSRQVLVHKVGITSIGD